MTDYRVKSVRGSTWTLVRWRWYHTLADRLGRAAKRLINDRTWE